MNKCNKESFIRKAWHRFLEIFGDIKISKYPTWIYYDPEYFKMPGEQLLKIVQNLKPGDVILRGYDSYADGYFIPEAEGHGRYSHAGMYTGDYLVTHIMHPHVLQTHVLEFMECDRIAVLRPKSRQNEAVHRALEYLEKKTEYDFDFSKGDETLYCYELCAECYKDLDIPREDARILGGLIKKKGCYLASSFFKSPDFDCIYECNPKMDILEYNFNNSSIGKQSS